jgi:tripartite-type tricarboxylate transporter receptor subunit TctC
MAIQRRHLIYAAGATALGGHAPLAAAQTVETLRVLAGFPPGGTTDAVSRQVGNRLRGTCARNVVVENRAGAVRFEHAAWGPIVVRAGFTPES